MTTFALLPFTTVAPLGAMAGRRVLSAAFFAVLAMALAGAGYHLAFAGSVSLSGYVTASPAFLAGGLLRAARRRSLFVDLAALLAAQVWAFSLFAWLGSGLSAARAAFHGEVHGGVHLTTTLVAVAALRAARFTGMRCSGTVQEALTTVARRVCVLTSARAAVWVPAGDAPWSCGGDCLGQDENAVAEVLPSGASGRRGPP